MGACQRFHAAGSPKLAVHGCRSTSLGALLLDRSLPSSPIQGSRAGTPPSAQPSPASPKPQPQWTLLPSAPTHQRWTRPLSGLGALLTALRRRRSSSSSSRSPRPPRLPTLCCRCHPSRGSPFNISMCHSISFHSLQAQEGHQRGKALRPVHRRCGRGAQVWGARQAARTAPRPTAAAASLPCLRPAEALPEA